MIVDCSKYSYKDYEIVYVKQMEYSIFSMNVNYYMYIEDDRHM